MRDFSYHNDKAGNDLAVVEKAIAHRKKKTARQQIVYTLILVGIVVMIVLWAGRKMIYVTLDGYVSTDVSVLRTEEDVYFLGSKYKVGDVVAPGDTLATYVVAHHFFNDDRFNVEPDIVASNRQLRLDYGVARQDLEVLRVRIAELERQLAQESHNIRFGLSDNHHRLRTEQELAEAREQYAALRRKLGVIWGAVAQTDRRGSRYHSAIYQNLSLVDRHDPARLAELGLLRYAISSDSAIITEVMMPSFALVLRGEPILSKQSLNLRSNNLAVVAYVMPEQMKYIHYNSRGRVKVTSDIAYNAHVVMLGARTEEIPGHLRNSLSRDYTASIVVLEIDCEQEIPFWSLADNMPVRIEFPKLDDHQALPEDYLMYNTTHGVDPLTIDLRKQRAREYHEHVVEEHRRYLDSIAALEDLSDAHTTAAPVALPGGEEPGATESVEQMPAKGAKQTPAPTPVAPPSGGTAGLPYKVIVSSGLARSSAERELRALKAAGHDGAELMEGDGRYRVSIGSYPTREQAQAMVSRLKQEGSYTGAWYMYRK